MQLCTLALHLCAKAASAAGPGAADTCRPCPRSQACTSSAVLQAADDLRQAVTRLEAQKDCSGAAAGQARQLLGKAYRLLGQAHMAEAEHSARDPAAAVEV